MSTQTTDNRKQATSRVPGFFRLNMEERRRKLAESGLADPADLALLADTGALPAMHADAFVENCIGGFTLPVGIATNFLVDGEEILVPMVVEESSVVAAASYGAKLARSGGGFRTVAAEPIATCQIEFFSEQESLVYERFPAVRHELAALADATQPRLLVRGGGVRGVELRQLGAGHFVIHMHVDTREAMGANIVNTMAEAVGARLADFLPVLRVGLRILTNLTTERVTRATCEVDPAELATADISGADAAQRIAAACELAWLDPYRAATHNKGVMNGIDPVVIVSGNDWRAVEAGCHAFAARSGQYRSLTRWVVNEAGRLQGTIEVPLALGTVGGVTRLHPSAAAALRLLGSPSSQRLASIVAAVGLAQNLSALRALACEGIQKGHMALHERNLDMMRRPGATASADLK